MLKVNHEKFRMVDQIMHKLLILKELRNCILCIIRVWLLFCSVRVYISLHFLPILLAKLRFSLSLFWFFHVSVSLGFSFQFFCSMF